MHVVQPLKHNIFFILELFLLTEVFEAKIDLIFFLNFLKRTSCIEQCKYISNTKYRVGPHYQTRRRELQISRVEEYFVENQGVWKCGETRSGVFDIFCLSKQTRKRRYKIVKIKFKTSSESWYPLFKITQLFM